MTTATLQLLDSFALRVDGEPVGLTRSGERLVALLALRRRPQPPGAVARALWPCSSSGRARRSLAALLDALPGPARRLLLVHPERLSLVESIHVDLDDALDAARHQHADPARAHASRQMFEADLLPDWFDDWLVEPQARYHRMRVAALACIARGAHEIDPPSAPALAALVGQIDHPAGSARRATESRAG